MLSNVKQDETFKDNSFSLNDKQNIVVPKKKKFLLYLKDMGVDSYSPDMGVDSYSPDMGVDSYSPDMEELCNASFDCEGNFKFVCHDIMTDVLVPISDSFVFKPTSVLLKDEKGLKDKNQSFCIQECIEFLDEISDSVLIDESSTSFIVPDKIVTGSHVNDRKNTTKYSTRESVSWLASTPKCKPSLDLKFSSPEFVKGFNLAASPITSLTKNTFNYSSQKFFNKVKNESPHVAIENCNNSVKKSLNASVDDLNKEYITKLCEDAKHVQLTSQSPLKLSHFIQNDIVIANKKLAINITFNALSSEGTECIQKKTMSTIRAADVNDGFQKNCKPLLNNITFSPQVIKRSKTFDKTCEEKHNSFEINSFATNDKLVLSANVKGVTYEKSACEQSSTLEIDANSFTLPNKGKGEEIKLIVNKTFQKICNKPSEIKKAESIMNITCTIDAFKNSVCEENNLLSNDIESFEVAENCNVHPVMNKTYEKKYDKICDEVLGTSEEKEIKSDMFDINVISIEDDIKHKDPILNVTTSLSPMDGKRKNTKLIINKTFDKICKEEFENIMTESEVTTDKSNIHATCIDNKGENEPIKQITNENLDKTFTKELMNSVIKKPKAIDELVLNSNSVKVSHPLHVTYELEPLYKNDAVSTKKCMDETFNKTVETYSGSIEVPILDQDILHKHEEYAINCSNSKDCCFNLGMVAETKNISDCKENVAILNSYKGKKTIKSTYLKFTTGIPQKLSVKHGFRRDNEKLADLKKDINAQKVSIKKSNTHVNSNHLPKSTNENSARGYEITPCPQSEFEDKTNITKGAAFKPLSFEFKPVDNRLKSETLVLNRHAKKTDIRSETGVGLPSMEKNKLRIKDIIADNQSSKKKFLEINTNGLQKQKNPLSERQIVQGRSIHRIGAPSLKNTFPQNKLIPEKVKSDVEQSAPAKNTSKGIPVPDKVKTIVLQKQKNALSERQIVQGRSIHRFGAPSLKNTFSQNKLIPEKVESDDNDRINNELKFSPRLRNRFGVFSFKNSFKENCIPKKLKIEGVGQSKGSRQPKKDNYRFGFPCHEKINESKK